jgi:hypothetical protein
LLPSSAALLFVHRLPLPEALFTSAAGPGKALEFVIVRPGGLTLEPPNGVINVLTGEVTGGLEGLTTHAH